MFFTVFLASTTAGTRHMDNEVAALFICDVAGVIKKASVGMSRALGYDSPDFLRDTGAWDCLSPPEKARVIAWAQMPHSCIYYNRASVGQICASAIKIDDGQLFVLEQPVRAKPVNPNNEKFKSVSNNLGLQRNTNLCTIQVDAHLRVKYWNLAAVNIMEIEHKHVIGKLLVDLPDMGCKRLLCSMLKVCRCYGCLMGSC